MMDKGLHALLHASTWRRNELVVVNLDSARGHLVQALSLLVLDGIYKENPMLGVLTWSMIRSDSRNS